MTQSALTIALINLAVGYVWIRLIPPRLRWPDLIRQPGMLVLILLIGIGFVCLALSAFVKPGVSSNWIIALALGLSWVAACFYYRSTPSRDGSKFSAEFLQLA